MNGDARFAPEAAAAVILPPAPDLFAKRGARLRALAAGHVQQDWLNWLAALFEAQQRVADVLVLAAPGQTLTPLVQTPALWLVPVQQACAALSREPEFAGACADVSVEQIAACLAHARGEASQASSAQDFVLAAAVQLVAAGWARQARHEAPAHDTCPCCGALALGSVVAAEAGRSGLRYLECSLCATRWNAVRARCTVCDQGERVHYFGLEGDKGAVRAEACDACGGYLKLFFPQHDFQLDPLADDLASLALDVLVGEAGYARAGPNLFLAAEELAR